MTNRIPGVYTGFFTRVDPEYAARITASGHNASLLGIMKLWLEDGFVGAELQSLSENTLRVFPTGSAASLGDLIALELKVGVKANGLFMFPMVEDRDTVRAAVQSIFAGCLIFPEDQEIANPSE